MRIEVVGFERLLEEDRDTDRLLLRTLDLLQRDGHSPEGDHACLGCRLFKDIKKAIQ